MDPNAIPEELMEALQELMDQGTKAFVLSAEDLEIFTSMDRRATHAMPATVQ
jgi:hypothetical protein